MSESESIYQASQQILKIFSKIDEISDPLLRHELHDIRSAFSKLVWNEERGGLKFEDSEVLNSNNVPSGTRDKYTAQWMCLQLLENLEQNLSELIFPEAAVSVETRQGSGAGDSASKRELGDHGTGETSAVQEFKSKKKLSTRTLERFKSHGMFRSIFSWDERKKMDFKKVREQVLKRTNIFIQRLYYVTHGHRQMPSPDGYFEFLAEQRLDRRGFYTFFERIEHHVESGLKGHQLLPPNIRRRISDGAYRRAMHVAYQRIRQDDSDLEHETDPMFRTVFSATGDTQSDWICNDARAIKALKPYICLLPTNKHCPDPIRLFSTREDWAFHMIQRHNFDWRCLEPRQENSESQLSAELKWCKYKSTTRDDAVQHLRSSHSRFSLTTTAALNNEVGEGILRLTVPEMFLNTPLKEWKVPGLGGFKTGVDCCPLAKATSDSLGLAENRNYFEEFEKSNLISGSIGKHLELLAVESLPGGAISHSESGTAEEKRLAEALRVFIIEKTSDIQSGSLPPNQTFFSLCTTITDYIKGRISDPSGLSETSLSEFIRFQTQFQAWVRAAGGDRPSSEDPATLDYPGRFRTTFGWRDFEHMKCFRKLLEELFEMLEQCWWVGVRGTLREGVVPGGKLASYLESEDSGRRREVAGTAAQGGDGDGNGCIEVESDCASNASSESGLRDGPVADSRWPDEEFEKQWCFTEEEEEYKKATGCHISTYIGYDPFGTVQTTVDLISGYEERQGSVTSINT